MPSSKPHPTEFHEGYVVLYDLTGNDRATRVAGVLSVDPLTRLPKDVLEGRFSPYGFYPVKHGAEPVHFAPVVTVEPGTEVSNRGEHSNGASTLGHSGLVLSTEHLAAVSGTPNGRSRTEIRGETSGRGGSSGAAGNFIGSVGAAIAAATSARELGEGAGSFPADAAPWSHLIHVVDGVLCFVGNDGRERSTGVRGAGGGNVAFASQLGGQPADIVTHLGDCGAPIKRGAGTAFTDPIDEILSGYNTTVVRIPTSRSRGGANDPNAHASGEVADRAPGRGGTGGSGDQGTGAANGMAQDVARVARDARTGELHAYDAAGRPVDGIVFYRDANGDARWFDTRTQLGGTVRSVIVVAPAGYGGNGGPGSLPPGAAGNFTPLYDGIINADGTIFVGLATSGPQPVRITNPIRVRDRSGTTRTAMSVTMRDGKLVLLDERGEVIDVASSGAPYIDTLGNVWIPDLANNRNVFVGNTQDRITLGIGNGVVTQTNRYGQTSIVVGDFQGTRRLKASISGIHYPVGSQGYTTVVNAARDDVRRLEQLLGSGGSGGSGDITPAAREALERQLQQARDTVADGERGLPLGSSRDAREAAEAEAAAGGAAAALAATPFELGLLTETLFGHYAGVGYPIAFNKPISQPAFDLSSTGKRWSAGYMMELNGAWHPVVPAWDSIPGVERPPPPDPPKEDPPPVGKDDSTGVTFTPGGGFVDGGRSSSGGGADKASGDGELTPCDCGTSAFVGGLNRDLGKPFFSLGPSGSGSSGSSGSSGGGAMAAVSGFRSAVGAPRSSAAATVSGFTGRSNAGGSFGGISRPVGAASVAGAGAAPAVSVSRPQASPVVVKQPTPPPGGLVGNFPRTEAARSSPTAGTTEIQPKHSPWDPNGDERQRLGGGPHQPKAPDVPRGGIRQWDALDVNREHSIYELANAIINVQNQQIARDNQIHPFAPDAVSGTGLKLPGQDLESVRLDQFEPGTVLSIRTQSPTSKTQLDVPHLVYRDPKTGENKIRPLGGDLMAEHVVGLGDRSEDIVTRYDTGHGARRDGKDLPTSGYRQGKGFSFENAPVHVQNEVNVDSSSGSVKLDGSAVSGEHVQVLQSQDGTLALLEVAQTFTAHQTLGAGATVQSHLGVPIFEDGDGDDDGEVWIHRATGDSREQLSFKDDGDVHRVVSFKAGAEPSDGEMMIWSDSEQAFVPSAPGGGGSTEFNDDVFRVRDNGDTSKKMAFELAGLTTATTRTKTPQDRNGTLHDSGGKNTFDSSLGAIVHLESPADQDLSLAGRDVSSGSAAKGVSIRGADNAGAGAGGPVTLRAGASAEGTNGEMSIQDADGNERIGVDDAGEVSLSGVHNVLGSLRLRSGASGSQGSLGTAELYLITS